MRTLPMYVQATWISRSFSCHATGLGKSSLIFPRLSEGTAPFSKRFSCLCQSGVHVSESECRIARSSCVSLLFLHNSRTFYWRTRIFSREFNSTKMAMLALHPGHQLLNLHVQLHFLVCPSMFLLYPQCFHSLARLTSGSYLVNRNFPQRPSGHSLSVNHGKLPPFRDGWIGLFCQVESFFFFWVLDCLGTRMNFAELIFPN